MTDWTPEIESRIRTFGDYQDKLMREAFNPKASALGSCLRIAFRGVVYGKKSYKKACEAMGLEPDFGKGFPGNVQKMIDLAAANHSDAADKLKQALPIGEDFAKEVAAHPGSMLENIRMAKRKNLKY